MENQVLSLELSKRFKELGIEIKTQFAYDIDTDLVFSSTKNYNIDECPAPTLSELLEIVPVGIETENRKYWFRLVKSYDDKSTVCYCCYYENSLEDLEKFMDKSPTEAVGKLLIYLKENKLI